MLSLHSLKVLLCFSCLLLMAERLLDLVVTRAEHHLSCAGLWAQTPGKDCSAAFPLMLCLPGGPIWFAAAETGTEHTLGNTHTSSVRPDQHRACWHTPLHSTIHPRKLGHSVAAEVRGGYTTGRRTR